MTNGNFNTIESRKTTKQRKYARKSSLPLDSGKFFFFIPNGLTKLLQHTQTGTLHANIGICRSETIQVVLDCSQGSGLVIGSKTACGKGHIITQIIQNSVADRSGCIQKGDRILSINKLYNLEAPVIRQILGDLGNTRNNLAGQYSVTAHWVEVEIEFDMADSVIPASGVFNVKLAKLNTNGLGITVNATNHGTFVISEVKPGSPAHRTGSLRAGDILLAVDAHTLQHFNVDALLKDNKNDFTTLTIKRNSLPDFLFDAQQRCNTLYGNNVPATATTGENTYYCSSSSSGSKNKLIGNTNDGTIKSQSCQPEFYQMPDELRQSTPIGQLRRPFLTKTETIRRPVENTQSLTTEADEQQYNDAYDPDYHQRYKR